MAELAASLIGIIEAGTKVAFLLSTLASNIGSAGKEAQVVAREIRSFCSIMRSLSQAVDQIKDGEYSSRCSELISEMTAVSQQMFTEILDLVENLRSVSDFSKTKLNLAGRMKWVLNKPKIAFLRTALETYKADLSLMLGSIHVAQGLNLQLRSNERKRGQNLSSQTTQEQHEADRDSKLLETLALDYQASLLELEDARHAIDDSDAALDAETDLSIIDENPGPPVVSQIAGMDSMIQALRSEVRSLSSATSSIYSSNTESIYSSISRQSSRLSQLIENLPLDNIPAFHDIKRTSVAFNNRGDLSPIQENAPPVRSSVVYVQTSASSVADVGIKSVWRSVADARVKEIEWWGWTGPNSTNAVEIISSFISCHEVLTKVLRTVPDEEAKDYKRLFTLISKDLVEVGQKNQKQYLAYIQRMVTLKGSLNLSPPPNTSQAAVPGSVSQPVNMLPADPTLAVNDRDYSPRQTAELGSRNSPKSEDMVEIFKSFRVSIDDPCWKVLPYALKKYGINAPWEQYALYIVYGGQERCLGLDEKPLILFKQLDKEGRKPMFMLRKTGPAQLV